MDAAERAQTMRSSSENSKRGETRGRIRALPSGGRGVVPRSLRGADAAAGAGLAGDRARRVDADPGADRQRQDARRLPVVHQPADVRAGAAAEARAAGSSTSRRSRRWRWTSSATCARRSPASPTSRGARGDALHVPGDRGPHRRHAGDRARAVPARAGRHPDHDAGVALPAAHVERARGAALVDTVIVDEIHALVPTKRGAHLALSLERLEALTRRRPAAAHRPVRDAAAARRSGALPRRRSRRGRQARVEPATQASAGADSATTPRREPIHDEFATRRRRAHAEFRPVTIVDASRDEAARADDRGAGRGHGAARPRPMEHPERAGVAGARCAHVDLDARSTRGCSSWCGRTARR